MASPPQFKVSPMEKCSFVCHLFILPLGLLYILWVLVPDEDLETWTVNYSPPKEWSVHLAVSAVLLFLAAPMLYAAMNALTVPRLTSSDILQDDYSRKQTAPHVLAKDMPAEATLPDISDMDPASLVWYHPKTTKAD